MSDPSSAATVTAGRSTATVGGFSSSPTAVGSASISTTGRYESSATVGARSGELPAVFLLIETGDRLLAQSGDFLALEG